MGGEQGRMEGRKVGRLSESQITLIKGFHGTRIVGARNDLYRLPYPVS